MKYPFLIAAFGSLLFLGLSCENNTITFSSSGTGDGGIYQTKDRGDTWEQKVFVSQQKKKITTIAQVNVTHIIADPKDSRVMYLITRESGLWKTTDAGEVWTQYSQGGGIHAMSIHPSDTQIIYLASGNTVQKSADGGNGWEEAYRDPRPGIAVSSIVVDAADPRHVTAATSAGDILESRDSGASWQVVYRFENPVAALLQAGATDVYFAAMPSQGVWRSLNEGKSWADITETLKDLSGAREFRMLIPDPATPRAFLLASAYGLFRTKDLGGSWDAIPLISRPGGVDIFSLAVNPKNSSQIYYAVPGALYRSANGGARWTTLALPSSKLPTALLVDHFNPNIMYMGFTKPK
ncbi:hypothetical protein A3J43_02440 [Candidatus Uhrbacteria bacterium RIFCSPHIGHO2_12_FULL_54_23]|uniref:Sortilin N-terminal domain-containing protein n=2 Tax=Candidatus Uhriibacteriota TaxID=1752732 RepID=A0A1F7UJB1_9BACT|nr:MAG: hypothetical protein A3J43_02440 [Candidatus Uhrbacteria bacterium RIFCSPHIGHO2_12_FULL_54_23]OGL83769.1 MAG: hypothetical protein A3B36_00785 [Candidatus Uhrbacteria bacterium RIFCSPLOWO2_01_FULL_55_36]